MMDLVRKRKLRSTLTAALDTEDLREAALRHDREADRTVRGDGRARDVPRVALGGWRVPGDAGWPWGSVGACSPEPGSPRLRASSILVVFRVFVSSPRMVSLPGGDWVSRCICSPVYPSVSFSGKSRLTGRQETETDTDTGADRQDKTYERDRTGIETSLHFPPTPPHPLRSTCSLDLRGSFRSSSTRSPTELTKKRSRRRSPGERGGERGGVEEGEAARRAGHWVHRAGTGSLSFFPPVLYRGAAGRRLEGVAWRTRRFWAGEHAGRGRWGSGRWRGVGWGGGGGTHDDGGAPGCRRGRRADIGACPPSPRLSLAQRLLTSRVFRSDLGGLS